MVWKGKRNRKRVERKKEWKKYHAKEQQKRKGVRRIHKTRR